MRDNNTEVHFLNVPLSLDNENQVFFGSLSTQETYFRSHILEQFDLLDSTYQRAEEGYFIRINEILESLYSVNYVMFKNTALSDKWMYGYVTKLEYKGDDCTYVYFKIDPFQSFRFDLTFHKSFVVRQTPSNQTDLNTLKDDPDEGVLAVTSSLSNFLNGFYLVFCSSDVTMADPTASTNAGCQLGSCFIPCQVWFYQDGAVMNADILRWSNAGFGDRIMSACYIPYKAPTLVLEKYADGSLKTMNTDGNHQDYTIAIVKPDYIKELSFPYMFIELLDTITGQTRKYNLDKFLDPLNPTFRIYGDICENPSYRIVPLNYRGQTDYSESMVVNAVTNLPITNNLYASYMLKNNNSIQSQFLNTAVGGLMSSLGGNPVGGAVSTLTGITGQVSKLADAKTMGNSVTNLSDSASMRINFLSQIVLNVYSMDDNHKSMCRNFWKMFGYPVSTLADINLPSSTVGYSYVKCVKANITASIPQLYLEEIKEMFNNGISLWRDPANFLTW